MPYQDETVKMEAAKTTQVDPPIGDKHIQLDNAIDSLESVNVHLLSLIRRVEGNDCPDEASPVRPCQALLDVLNEAPNRLREIENDAHRQIELLEGHLFR